MKEKEIAKIISSRLDERFIKDALRADGMMAEWRCPLYQASGMVYDRLAEMVNEVCEEQGWDTDDYIDVEEVFMELDLEAPKMSDESLFEAIVDNFASKYKGLSKSHTFGGIVVSYNGKEVTRTSGGSLLDNLSKLCGILK